MKLFYLTILFTFLFCEQSELPKGFTKDELEMKHLIFETMHRTVPPIGPVRSIAEYEPMQGVLIRYPFGISTSLISAMSEDEIIYCLVASNSQSSAYNTMNSAGVNMENVEFILGSTDSYWTRDYGPWWIVDGNGEIGIVDFSYNRPRPMITKLHIKFHNI